MPSNNKKEVVKFADKLQAYLILTSFEFESVTANKIT